MQQHNFRLQEILLDIVTKRKTLRTKEMKEYYRLFADNKTESLIFDQAITDHDCPSLQAAPDNREALNGLKRLHCRLIEKMLVKVVMPRCRSRTT